MLPRRPPRDHRLDFFRGLLQLFIFIGHVPDNLVALLIHRSYGFSDSSEMFVLLSGFTLGSVFALKQAHGGWATATRDLLGRVLKLYGKHLAMFAGFTGLVLWSGYAFDRPDHPEGIGLLPLLQQPVEALARALVLDYQPIFLDILPVFLAMMLALPAYMLLPMRLGWLSLAPSLALWLAVQATGLGPSTWPARHGWTFDPLAWQFLFMLGAYLGREALYGRPPVPRHPVLLGLAIGILAFAAPVQISWVASSFDPALPALLEAWLWPFDKPRLSFWPLAHSLALAYVITWFARPGQRIFESAWAMPLVICGRHSLDVFCVGIFLSFAGYLVLQEGGGTLPLQIAVSLAGCLLLLGFARLLEGRPRPRPAVAPAE